MAIDDVITKTLKKYSERKNIAISTFHKNGNENNLKPLFRYMASGKSNSLTTSAQAQKTNDKTMQGMQVQELVPEPHKINKVLSIFYMK